MNLETQLLVTLGEIKGDIGGLTAEVRSLNETLKSHIVDDKKVSDRVNNLEHQASRVRGMLIAVSAVGGVLGAVGTAVAKALLN